MSVKKLVCRAWHQAHQLHRQVGGWGTLCSRASRLCSTNVILIEYRIRVQHQLVRQGLGGSRVTGPLHPEERNTSNLDPARAYARDSCRLPSEHHRCCAGRQWQPPVYVDLAI
jgi:hypothetical protein